MKQELLIEKETELNTMLKKAHQMLVDIQIPVAPIELISVKVNPSTSKKISAECIENHDGGFVLSFHAYSVYEPEINGEKYWTFSGMLHELIHTCYNGKEYGLWEHKGIFIKYAEEIKRVYGYNILSSIIPADYKYIAEYPLYSIVCPDCGAVMCFYSEKTWKKYKDMIEQGRQLMCVYCKNKNLVLGKVSK